MQSEPLGYTGARACLIEWGKPSCLLAMQLCNSLPLHFSDIFRKSGQQISYRHLMGDDSLLTSVNFDIQLTPPLELCPSLKSQWNALWTNVCVCVMRVFFCPFGQNLINPSLLSLMSLLVQILTFPLHLLIFHPLHITLFLYFLPHPPTHLLCHFEVLCDSYSIISRTLFPYAFMWL